jgi:hypothetical protein
MFPARRRQWAGQVAFMGKRRSSLRSILVEKFEGEKLLESPMDRWKNNNVKVYLKEVELESAYWIHLAWVKTSGGSTQKLILCFHGIKVFF